MIKYNKVYDLKLNESTTLTLSDKDVYHNIVSSLSQYGTIHNKKYKVKTITASTLRVTRVK